ncbi:similar to Saccharomyces cerevisiae YGL138C Putative protein of unknown function [Maudiozyma saulgeensis]|uniref:Uncharacterized protein n=1 Tax=Maudiozyma saulgeensis TaxID=1789683 RepID=A0A1X7R000_9SACH|nr:similar to Saccharomyces cerevisiae YGL138C Putative protein of unknown function [Kazachstania saulgeensis]
MLKFISNKLIVYLVVLLAVITTTNSYLLFPEIVDVLESADQVCETDKYFKGQMVNSYGITKFTGVRVFKVYTVTSQPFAIQESIRFVYCEDGKKQYQKIVIQEEKNKSDIYWKEPFPIKSAEKEPIFKMSRRDGYINHDKTYVLPGSIIGGLFQCFDLNCSSANSRPLLPVYSYTHKKMWTESTRGNSFTNWTIDKYIPLVSTSNDNISSKQLLKQILSNKKRHRTPRRFIREAFGKGHLREDNISVSCFDKWCTSINIDEKY